MNAAHWHFRSWPRLIVSLGTRPVCDTRVLVGILCINIILGTDLWQLPPVQDIPIYANPLHKATGDRYDAGEQRILSMFWDMHDPKKPDTIQHLYELTVSQRSAGDQWLNAVLSAARDGAETWEMYC